MDTGKGEQCKCQVVPMVRHTAPFAQAATIGAELFNHNKKFVRKEHWHPAFEHQTHPGYQTLRSPLCLNQWRLQF